MKKPRRRRVSKRSLQAKLRRNMFVIIVLLLLAGWGTATAITWPGFRPQRVDVTGTRRVDPNAVRGAAHISPTANVWLLNPWRIAARVDALPWVGTVGLLRRYPNRVTLVVHERTAESCLVARAGTFTIDATDRVLENGCALQMRYIVPALQNVRIGATVSDAQLARLRNDAATLIAQRVALRSAEFDRDDGLVVVTKDAVMLLLGEDAELAQTSALLGPIFDAVRKQRKRIGQVDLRAPSTPVVRYKDSSDKTEKRRGAA